MCVCVGGVGVGEVFSGLVGQFTSLDAVVLHYAESVLVHFAHASLLLLRQSGPEIVMAKVT